jgi:hypothetical protein
MVRTWIHFFIGTPKRFLITASACLVIYFCFRPDVLKRTVTNLLSGLLNAIVGTVQPLEGPLLSILIALAIAVWLIHKIRG